MKLEKLFEGMPQREAPPPLPKRPRKPAPPLARRPGRPNKGDYEEADKGAALPTDKPRQKPPKRDVVQRGRRRFYK